MSNKVCFKYVKLTNNRKPPKGQITLNSMRKYIPCVVVLKYKSKKKPEIVHVQDFPMASFFAVTEYQNDQVTQLEIDNNPFAKAFRDFPSDLEGIMQNSGTSTTSSPLCSLPPPLLSVCPPVPCAVVLKYKKSEIVHVQDFPMASLLLLSIKMIK